MGGDSWSIRGGGGVLNLRWSFSCHREETLWSQAGEGEEEEEEVTLSACFLDASAPQLSPRDRRLYGGSGPEGVSLGVLRRRPVICVRVCV